VRAWLGEFVFWGGGGVVVRCRRTDMWSECKRGGAEMHLRTRCFRSVSRKK
jgi:hypothetical protein